MRYIIPILLLLLMIGCPKPDENLDPAFCDDGYHPCGPDSQECCLDTTSHEFAWEIDTIGNYASWINDFAIINKNDIWAVGKIESDSGSHNLAHWDGNSWTLKKTNAQYLQLHVSPELYSIKYFSDDNIWALGGWPFHWDGLEWRVYHLADMGIITYGLRGKMWASNPSDIYFVGSEGQIVHYDGVDFHKIESGVDTRLVGVSGSSDGENVFIVGYNLLTPSRTSILQINGGIAEILYDETDYDTDGGDTDWGTVSAVSVLSDTAYIATYQGLMKYVIETDSILVDRSFECNGYETMKVLSPNDIILNGGGFIYGHFNGKSWIIDEELNEQYFFASNCSEIDEDIAVLGGYSRNGLQAVIGRGYRN